MSVSFWMVFFLGAVCYEVVFSKEVHDDSFSTKYKMKFEEIFGKNYNENIFNKPKSVTESLDCEIKKLALSMAEKLNAGEGNELQSVFNALQLELCDHTFMNENKYKSSELKIDSPFNIFVDNVNGKLKTDGNFDAPFQDIQSAVNECQMLLTSGLPGKCVVNIRGGVYNISSPLLISSSNLILTNFQDEKVVITSDLSVNANWKLFKSSIDIFLDLSPIFENLVPKQSTNSVFYVGSVAVSQCKEACEENPLCSSFIYFDNSTKDFADQCYIRTDGMWNTQKFVGAISGKKVKSR